MKLETTKKIIAAGCALLMTASGSAAVFANEMPEGGDKGQGNPPQQQEMMNEQNSQAEPPADMSGGQSEGQMRQDNAGRPAGDMQGQPGDQQEPPAGDMQGKPGNQQEPPAGDMQGQPDDQQEPPAGDMQDQAGKKKDKSSDAAVQKTGGIADANNSRTAGKADKNSGERPDQMPADGKMGQKPEDSEFGGQPPVGGKEMEGVLTEINSKLEESAKSSINTMLEKYRSAVDAEREATDEESKFTAAGLVKDLVDALNAALEKAGLTARIEAPADKPELPETI